MTNEERARFSARISAVQKRILDLSRPEPGSRDEYVHGLLTEALDAAEAECVPVTRPGTRKPRKGKGETGGEDEVERARRQVG